MLDSDPHVPNEATRNLWLASLAASWKGRLSLDALDSRGTDWPWLLQAAKRHRILESVCCVWDTLPDVPDAIKCQSWMASEKARHRGEAVRQALNELQGVADRHGLQIVVLKSPTYLTEASFGFDKRYVQDIDLLVHETDLDILRREIECLGYQGEGRRRRHKGREWLFRRGDMLIEVHLSASNRRRFQTRLSTDAIIGRAGPFDLHPPLLRMAHTDDAIVLALHAYHHKYRRLLWLRDFCVWWRIRDPDPHAVLAAFKALSLERIGWITWMGMECLGWRRPSSWTARQWDCSSRLSQCVQAFWQDSLFRLEETYSQALLRRQIELRSAKGVRSKFGALTPLFSWRNISELYRLRSRQQARRLPNDHRLISEDL